MVEDRRWSCWGCFKVIETPNAYQFQLTERFQGNWGREGNAQNCFLCHECTAAVRKTLDDLRDRNWDG